MEKENIKFDSGILLSSNKSNTLTYNIPNYLNNEYITKFEPILFDQGDSKMCVPCAVSLLLYIQNYKRCGDYINIPDPVYIFGSSNINTDNGMSYENAMSILKEGCSYFNRNILKKFNSEYNIYNYDEAFKYANSKRNNKNLDLNYFKVNSYYYLHNNNEIKFAITNFGAANIVIPIYPSFFKPDFVNGSFYIKIFDDNRERLHSYHMITVIGWKGNNWIVQNSYGKKYGDFGISFLPMDYEIKEAWTCISENLIKKDK